LTGKTKKSKRKKAPEPEPDRHELPPAEEIDRVEPRTSLTTGLEKEKQGLGVPIGPKWLSRFERARIVGARALQISMGAPVMVDMKKAPSGLFALAETELRSGVLPMTVRRTKPTGETADIPLSILLKNTRLD
jgi:DNA-directed RNA polymerase subunit K/omega